ncbi:hypothetical protein FRC17_003820 [Serendipita sp. 399]|nr:hypothetical protein FRC17_003820 [Serendipita sp. 399]
MTSTSPLLSVKDVSCVSGKKTLITNISFEVNEGDCLVLVGRSGSGKSTLLKCLAHLNVYDGDILYRGKPPRDHGISFYRTKVQYVPQRASLLPSTPRRFLETILSFQTRKSNEKYSSSVDGPIELAENWGVDSTAWDRPWSSLSGGEAQRVNLALAVGLPGAEILLLDEPTSALDEETSERVEQDLLNLLRSRKTLQAIIWITHSHAQERRVGTRHLSLETGGRLSEHDQV